MKTSRVNMFKKFSVAAFTFLLASTVTHLGADQSQSYTYNALGLVETEDGPRTDVSDVTSYTYDAAGNISTMTNGKGQVTQFVEYDSQGNLERMIAPNGVETLMTYHPRGWLSSSTIKHATNSLLDATTTYEYDGVSGLVTKMTLPNGMELNYEYDNARRLTAIENNLGERIVYTLDAAGNKTQETFSKNGNITRVVQRTFDELSRLMDVVGQNGQVTHFDYDANDNNTHITDGRNNTIIKSYDALNRVETITQADTTQIDFLYDAADRVLGVMDPRNVSTQFYYDPYDNAWLEISPDRGFQSRVFDNANNLTHLITQKDLAEPVPLTVQSYGEAQETLITGTDNLDIETRSLGNANAQDVVVSDPMFLENDGIKFEVELLKEITTQDASIQIGFGNNPTNAITAALIINLDTGVIVDLVTSQILAYLYEPIPVGTIIELHLYPNKTATYLLQGGTSGSLAVNTSFDASNPVNIFLNLDPGSVVDDELDMRLNVGNTPFTYARNHLNQYSYDELNRLTNIVFQQYANHPENMSFTYDDQTNGNVGVGKLTGYTDESGSTSLKYDYQGRLIEKNYTINGKAYSQAWTYDKAGNITSETYPTGRIVEYTLDAVGRVSAIGTRANAGAPLVNLITNVEYQPFGGVESYDYGNGVGVAYTYDTDGRIEAINATGSAPIQNKIYSYDLANNIVGIDDVLNSAYDQDFILDELNRIERDEGEYGYRDYVYDDSSNRTSRTSNTNGTMNLTYESTSNRLIGIWASGEITNDARGNIVKVAYGSGWTQHYKYNSQNRLAAYWTSNDAVIPKKTYQYNAMGQRVYDEDAQGTDKDMHYNQQGQYIGRYNFWADPQQYRGTLEWVYLAGMPIAQIKEAYNAVGTKTSSEIFYLHNDHLMTPRLMTSQNQTVVWRWDSDAFGEGSIDRDPDGDGTKQWMPLRFPGQIEEQQSGLYYNYFRDYDPKLGRYVQSDPLGIISNNKSPILDLAEDEGLMRYNFHTMNTIGANYNYANSNPTIFLDFYGLTTNTGTSTLNTCMALVAYAVYISAKIISDCLDENENMCPIQFAKGGKQNIDNEYVRDVQKNNPPDPCSYLRSLYASTKDSIERRKIKQAMKRFNCDGKDRFK